MWGVLLGDGGDTVSDRRLDREVDAKLVAGLHGVVAGIGDMLSGGRIEDGAGEDRRLLGERMAEVILEVVLAVRIPDFVSSEKDKGCDSN